MAGRGGGSVAKTTPLSAKEGSGFGAPMGPAVPARIELILPINGERGGTDCAVLPRDLEPRGEAADAGGEAAVNVPRRIAFSIRQLCGGRQW